MDLRLSRVRNSRHSQEYRVYSADGTVYLGTVYTDRSPITRWTARTVSGEEISGLPTRAAAAAELNGRGGVRSAVLDPVDVPTDGRGNRLL